MNVLEYIIPAVALIIVQLIISYKQQRLNDVKTEMTVKAIKDDIARLEAKQDKHNSLIERVIVLEQRDLTIEKIIDIFKNANEED